MLSTLLFPSATYFLSPCLLFSSCPHQLSPPSYLSTIDCSSNFGSRRGCLYALVFISCCLCWNRMCVSACFTEQINHNRYGSAFLISAKSQAEPAFSVILLLGPEFQPWGVTVSRAAYKSCLLHQNWQLLTPTMALNLPITFSNLKRFVPIKPIMPSINEELNLFWFGCKRGHLYNISVE